MNTRQAIEALRAIDPARSYNVSVNRWYHTSRTAVDPNEFNVYCTPGINNELHGSRFVGNSLAECVEKFRAASVPVPDVDEEEEDEEPTDAQLDRARDAAFDAQEASVLKADADERDIIDAGRGHLLP